MTAINIATIGSQTAAAGFSLKLTNQTLVDTQTTPTNSVVSVFLDLDGDFRGTNVAGSVFAPADEWIFSKTGFTASDYEMRLTVQSGDGPTSGDTVGSWLVLSSNRSFVLTQAVVGFASGVWLIEVGLAGTSSALASCTVTVDVEEEV